MIGWLRGRLRARDGEGRLVLDVGGVGYVLSVPLSVAGQVQEGEVLELHVHTYVREDQLALYGFEDEAQHQAFLALIQVSKVGPRLALAVLGGVSPAELADAVDRGDLARLTTISGVGKRLAERLTVELRGKLEGVARPHAQPPRAATGGEPSAFRDLRSALHNLQYRPKEIDAVIDELRAEAADAPFDALLRRALASLRR